MLLFSHSLSQSRLTVPVLAVSVFSMAALAPTSSFSMDEETSISSAPTSAKVKVKVRRETFQFVQNIFDRNNRTIEVEHTTIEEAFRDLGCTVQSSKQVIQTTYKEYIGGETVVSFGQGNNKRGLKYPIHCEINSDSLKLTPHLKHHFQRYLTAIHRAPYDLEL